MCVVCVLVCWLLYRCKVLDTLAVIEFLRQKLQDHEQTQIILVSILSSTYITLNTTTSLLSVYSQQYIYHA